MRVLDAIMKAMEGLGGEASLSDLYLEVNKYRPTPEHSIRGRLYEHSSDCDIYKKTSLDLFESSEGKGRGIWKFRKKTLSADGSVSWKDERFNKQKFSIGQRFPTKENIRNLSGLSSKKDTQEVWGGIVSLANAVLLFTTLDKKEAEDQLKYNDYFDGEDFFWESQNQNTLKTPAIKNMIDGCDVFLFSRIYRKDPWVYLGPLIPVDYDSNVSPMQFQFEILDFQDNADKHLSNIYKWKKNNEIQVPKIATSGNKINVRSSAGQKRDKDRDKAVELHAMKEAIEYYKSIGFEVSDLSDMRGIGFDIKCKKGKEIIEVEVKGIQRNLGHVTVTKNEVDNAKTTGNKSHLFIVFNQNLVKKDGEYSIKSSDTHIIEDWRPNDSDLEPLSFNYYIKPRE